MRVTRSRRARSVLAAVVIAALGAGAGCRQLAAIAQLTRPREINEPTFTFPDGADVVVLIDPGRGVPMNPLFDRALFERLEQYFRRYESRARLVPLSHVHQVRRMNPDFAEWSLQRIGRELDADFVLHVFLERLTLQEAAGSPVIHPSVDINMRVIDVDHPAETARVWPEEERGYAIHCERPPYQPFDRSEIDRDIAKLGRDVAYDVMLPFFEVDLEETRPHEP